MKQPNRIFIELYKSPTHTNSVTIDTYYLSRINVCYYFYISGQHLILMDPFCVLFSFVSCYFIGCFINKFLAATAVALAATTLCYMRQYRS